MTSSKDSSPTLASGDLVLLDYDIWAEGGGRSDLVTTTHADVAQAAGIPMGEGRRSPPSRT